MSALVHDLQKQEQGTVSRNQGTHVSTLQNTRRSRRQRLRQEYVCVGFFSGNHNYVRV